MSLLSTCFKPSWSVRKQLLVSFCFLGAASLLIVMIVSIVNTVVLGNSTETTATNALVTQVQTNMITSSNATADVISGRFIRMQQAVVKTLAGNLKELIKPDAGLFYRQSFFGYSDAYLSPDGAYEPRQAGFATLEYSSYTIPNAFPANITAFLSQSGRNNTLNLSAHLDPYMKSLYLANQDVVQMYVGFPNKVHRLYPGQTIGSRSYDPTARGWYKAARNAPNGAAIITDPYVDAFGKGWMITVAQAVYDENNNLAAVVGVDVTIKAIQASILRIRFLDDQTGYASMIQLTETGTTRRLLVVAHPKWNSPTSDPNAVAPTLKEIDKDFPEDAFSRLQSTAAADAIFDYSTTNPVVNYYVSHSCICLPLPVPTGGCCKYAVMTIVPSATALSAVPTLQSDISGTRTIVVWVSVGVAAGTILIAFAVVYFMADLLAHPMEQLVETSKALTKTSAEEVRDYGKFATGIEDVDRSDEIGELVHSFKLMISALHQKEVKKKTDSKVPKNRWYQQATPWQRSIFQAPQEFKSEVKIGPGTHLRYQPDSQEPFAAPPAYRPESEHADIPGGMPSPHAGGAGAAGMGMGAGMGAGLGLGGTGFGGGIAIGAGGGPGRLASGEAPPPYASSDEKRPGSEPPPF